MAVERDFKQDIKLNRFKLEEECEQHSEIYNYWAELANTSKVELEKLEAKIEMRIRETAIDNKGNLPNGVKATADAIKAAVILDDKVIEKKKEVVVLAAGKASIDHKKSELDNLVKLWIAGYFSDPSRKRMGSDMAADQLRKNLNN